MSTGLGLGLGLPFIQTITASASAAMGSGYYYTTGSAGDSSLPIDFNNSGWLPTTKFDDGDAHGSYEGGSGIGMVHALFDVGSDKTFTAYQSSDYAEGHYFAIYYWTGAAWANWDNPAQPFGFTHQWNDQNRTPSTPRLTRYIQVVVYDTTELDPPVDSRLGNLTFTYS
jgi:hypothetical protein